MYQRSVPIIWPLRKQSVRAVNTCEAAYVAIYDTSRMTTSLGFLDWFIEEDRLPLVFVDNQSALKLSANSLVTKKSKHINLRYHAVRDHCKDLCYCPTDKNLADPLTKPLPH